MGKKKASPPEPTPAVAIPTLRSRIKKLDKDATETKRDHSAIKAALELCKVPEVRPPTELIAAPIVAA